MRIGILSRSERIYSTRRLRDVARDRGHDVEVIDHTQCSVLIEQGNPIIQYNGRRLRGFDAIVPRIGTSVTFYGSAVVRQFEVMGVFSAVNSQAIVRARDKLRSIQILSREGLGLPKTAFARKNANVDDILADVGGTPVVIKLLEGTQGLGVVLAESNKAAKSVIQAFHSIDANILVQEFIREARSTDIRAFVVDGEVVGAMQRIGAEGEFRSNLHRGGSARVINLTHQEKLTAIRAAEALGLEIAGVDMLPSRRGPLVIEVNASPGLEGIEGATRVDIAGKIIQYVERNANNKGIRDTGRG
ncbi:MAG: 30S ribosomal protein S6--L-glutamate ligase [Bacteroidota bacterium]